MDNNEEPLLRQPGLWRLAAHMFPLRLRDAPQGAHQAALRHPVVEVSLALGEVLCTTANPPE